MSFLLWEGPFLTQWPQADQESMGEASFSLLRELFYDCIRYTGEEVLR
jgi:hypothetical protein